jgi:predicted transcriptional regulator of viral defense system
MSHRDVKLVVLREAAAAQWDLITAAQCTRLGINGQDIYQFRHRGALTTVLRGVYLAQRPTTMASTRDPVTVARASWLALGADRWAHERRTAPHPDAVIAHSTALSVHGIAELLTGRPELVMAKRARKSHSGVTVIEATHQPVEDEITTIDGLPVQTVPTAIEGLINRPQGPPGLTYLAAALHTSLTAGISRDELLDRVVAAAARHSCKHIDLRNCWWSLQSKPDWPASTPARRSPLTDGINGSQRSGYARRFALSSSSSQTCASAMSLLGKRRPTSTFSPMTTPLSALTAAVSPVATTRHHRPDFVRFTYARNTG